MGPSHVIFLFSIAIAQDKQALQCSDQKKLDELRRIRASHGSQRSHLFKRVRNPSF
jgi:hypothetical protein